jgi:hypothetical protein
MYQSAEQGALSSLYAATSPDVTGGSLYQPDGFLHLRGHPVRAKIAQRALDEDVARQLWEVSERLTGVEFPLDEQEVAARA